MTVRRSVAWWRLPRLATLLTGLGVAPVACAQSPTRTGAAPVAPARDAALLSPSRVQALPPAARRAWESYLARSATAQALDRALLERELQQTGASAMTRAPLLAQSFSYDRLHPDVWFATDSANAFVASMLSFQTPSGGWSKHVDFSKGARAPGQSFFGENERWQYIATIDNDATTAELRLLLHRQRVRPDSAVGAAIARGVRYLLDAQFPTGCWPQVWPLQGGYHDAATFNDDAIVKVLRLLDEIAQRAPGGWSGPVADSLRARAAGAVARGIDCMLQAQVVVRGVPTVWGQQHDPITLAPTSARSYELTSLSSKESAAVFDFLLAHASRDARIPPALAHAAAWFERSAISGMRYDGKNGLVPDTMAGLLWARMYDIDSNRPMFANRDGVKLFAFDALTDRREGYGWYSDQAASTLKRYRKWLAERATSRG